MYRTFVGTTVMALSLAFLPVESFGQQADTASPEQARADARKAAKDAKDAAQKSVDSANRALKAAANEQSQQSAEKVRGRSGEGQ